MRKKRNLIKNKWRFRNMFNFSFFVVGDSVFLKKIFLLAERDSIRFICSRRKGKARAQRGDD